MRRLLYGGVFNRQAKCLRTRRVGQNADVRIQRGETGAWRARDLVECGHMTCPHCGPRRCREAAAVLALAIRRALTGGGDAWMLTLTPPHYADEPMGVVLDRLYAASALLWETDAWQRFAAFFGLDGKGARVRVLDVSFGGKNGAHPHFHVLLLPERTHYYGAELRLEPPESRGETIAALAHDEDVTGEGCETLAQAWARCLALVGAKARTPAARAQLVERGLMLSGADKAERYFVRWGLANEVGATTAKGRNHLRLLDLAATGLREAGDAYVAWRAAVDGRAWVTGLERVRKRFGIEREDVRAYLDELRANLDEQARAEGREPVRVAPLALVVRPHLYEAAISVDWGAVFAHVDEQERAGVPDLQLALDRYLLDELWKLRTRRRDDQPPDDRPPDG